MQQAKHSIDILASPDNVKILGNVLKTNVAVCGSVGDGFGGQMRRIWTDLLALYSVCSVLIGDQVTLQGMRMMFITIKLIQGEIATKTPKVRALRTIKKEVLKLIGVYISEASDLNMISSDLIPQLLEAILLDYHKNVPLARDLEVLGLMASIIFKLQGLMTDKIPLILDATFQTTLTMISANFEDFPELRVVFYKMLHAIVNGCFEGT